MSDRLSTNSDDCIDHGQKGNADGYGHSGNVKLHRKIFAAINGYMPLCVLHTCDNPRCINPRHLVAGDWDKNNKDRAAKGRSAKRVHARRRLTDEQAQEIRRRFSIRKRRDPFNGVCALAQEFGVDTGVIYQISGGRTYL